MVSENQEGDLTEHAGFRLFLSTEDQTTCLLQEIEDAFREQKLVFVACVDLQKAFDKMWTDGLLEQLQRTGVSCTMHSG